MAKEKFIWLERSCVARSGRKLEHGQEYFVSDFNEAIVAEWVRTGAAAYADAKSKSKKEV